MTQPDKEETPVVPVEPTEPDNNAEVARLQKELRDREKALEEERAKVATLTSGMHRVVATTVEVYYVNASGPEEAEKWYYANAHLSLPTEKKVDVVVDRSPAS